MNNGQVVLIEKKDFDLLGRQLDDQYDRATGGMREVLKFGAMMMMLRSSIVSKVGKVATGGADSKGTGIKAFVDSHTKKVKLSTAYRFEDVAKAVVKAYELPAKITKRLTFEELVTKDPKDLDIDARRAQEKVFEFVDGTSQKSLLDEFREEKNRGGDTGGSKKKLTPEQEHKLYLENAKNDFINALQAVDALHEKHVWNAPSITDAMLSDSADLLAEMAKEMRAWLKIPRRERTKLDASRNGSSES